MFDYVIVGAGSAGCVLANRLTEDSKVTVLLIEAGGPDKKQEVHIPAAFSKLFKGPCDWAYYTEPQPRLNDRRLYWPRGRMLGGSSSMNAMIYSRGNRYDYDRWREMGGGGWGYEDVLPYFKKAEHQERGASRYHGAGGPLNVADLRLINPLSRAFVEAGLEHGLPPNDDFNGPEQEGVGFFQVNQKRGKRHSAAAAYLKPVIKRPNLTVETDAQLTNIRFDKNRAAAVTYVQGGRPRDVSVGKELILCGGAVNSPQLLMLSGVGPAAHLEAIGVPVVADLPGVGHNLQDHLAVAVSYGCTRPISLAGAERVGNVLSYLLFRKGMLTSNVAEAGAFLKTRSDSPAPDIELIFAPAYFINHGFTQIEGHGFTMGAVLLRPQSAGRVSLRSNDPLEQPVIQPDYLASEGDLQLLAEGLKLCRSLAQAKALAPFRGNEVHPKPPGDSHDEICRSIRAAAETLYHPVGTCKMGDDPMAVVDWRLRVRGVEGLRVVDASVMPAIITGHTNAPTIMLAEKAADMIKEDA